MAKVKYKGSADRRTLLAADFRRLGVEEDQKTAWDASNSFVAEVTDEAAEALSKLEGFEVLENEPDSQIDDNSSTRDKKGKNKGK